MAFLSQASHLGSVLLPHDAFQEHAAHLAEWSAQLSSKGSERTCIRSGLATFLHCACTAHADLVVDLWAFDGEGSSNRVFLFPHDVWACFVARSVRKECQQYQRLSILPLNPLESGDQPSSYLQVDP